MYQRYLGRAWEKHFLPRLTALEVERLPKQDALVILPIGAVEQHGPHLPIFTDTLIAEALVTGAFEYLPEDAPIWLLPPVPYGKSNEHIGNSGVFTLSVQTLQSIIRDIGQSLQASGFRRLLLFTTHGGNYDLLNMMAREVRIATGLMVFRLNGSSLDTAEELLTERERKLGIHAGDYETSLLMNIQPDWVHHDQLVCEYPEIPEHLGWGKFAWVMNDISATGVAGDATAATPEKGRQMFERSCRSFAHLLQEMAKFEIAEITANSRNQKELT
ncbi:creatininase family protein [Brevibacillus sp. B_LB10_24]|uniref:creatininase family protein n=1 Tax=Brevibacillus sp. B_LB10_24 TaxID=3380645 RepID=UPI0038B81F56